MRTTIGNATLATDDEVIEDEVLKDTNIFGINVDMSEGTLVSTLEMCRRLSKLGKKGCVWVSFDGYDNDPREVWEIPECMVWTKKLLEELGDDMAALGDDLGNHQGLGLGIVALHVVAGLGSYHPKGNGHYDFSVSPFVLQHILEIQKA